MVSRPPHIRADDWRHMSWHAREKAQRAAGIPRLTVVDEAPDRPRTARAPRLRRRIRVYRVEPCCWEITDGVSTARAASAEVAWRLLAHLEGTG